MNSDVYYRYDSGGNSAVQFCTPEQQIQRDQEDQRKLIEELEKEGVPELDDISDDDDDSIVGQYSNNKAGSGPGLTKGMHNNSNGQKQNSGGVPTRNQYDQMFIMENKLRTSGNWTNGYHKTDGHVNGNGAMDDRELMLSVREREIHELKKQLCEKLRECEALESKLTVTMGEKNRATQSLQRVENDLSEFKEKFDQLARKEETLLKDIAFQKLELQDKDKMLRLLQNGSQEDTRLAALERQIQAKEEKYRQEIDNLNGEYESLYRKHKQILADNLELEMKVKNLKDQNNELSTEKSEEIVRLLTEKNILEEQLQKRTVESRTESPLSEWRDVEKGLRAEIAQKDTLIHTLRVELLARSHDVEGGNSQFQIFKSRLAELEAKLKEKETEVVNLTIRSARASVQDETSQHKLTQQLKKLEDEKCELSNELSKSRSALADKDSEIENLKTENETVKRTYLDQQDVYETEKRNLQEKINALNESLVELQTNHSRFCQKELENKAREIELLKAESETKTHQLEALKSLIEITEKAKSLDTEDVNEQMKLSEEQRAVEAEIFERETFKLNQEVSKLSSLNQQLEVKVAELQSELTSVSEARSCRRDVESSRRDAETSPAERCLVQSEVMTLLQTVAQKHEAERMEYEDRISELCAKLEAASSNGSQKAASGSSLPEKDHQPELLVQLWRKYEELSKSHGDLTGRIRDSESELSRALSETDSLKDRLRKAQAEYLTCFDKYNKLKVQAKHYRDYYEGANKKLKDDMESEKKKWEKERSKWKRAEEGWTAERLKQERSLAEVLTELQRIKQSQPPPITLDGIFKLYNEEAKRLENL